MNPDQWGHPPSRPVTLALTGSRNMLISYKTSVSPFGSLASEHLHAPLQEEKGMKND